MFNIKLFFLTLFALAALACTGRKRPPSGTSQDLSGHSDIRFQDITEAAGLGDFVHHTGAFGKKWMPETFGSGGGFLDYNGDGWPDILLVGGGSWPAYTGKHIRQLWLYRNNQDGTFTLQTDEAGLGEVSTYGFGITAADYDNDGDEDFFLTTVYENRLFRNDGGVFTEVGKAAGVTNQSTWSTAALFFDADRDGWPDLYAGNYVAWSPETDIFCSIDGVTKEYCTPLLYDGVPGRFYHNNGDGTFSDWTQRAGFLPAPGKTLGNAETDYNRDGWPDLIVSSDTERDLLYMNNGDGTFTERGMLSGIAFDEYGRAAAGMGVDTGVVDSSGHPSIFIGNFSNEMIGVFRYLGNNLFNARSSVSKIGRPSLLRLTFGLFLFDVDCDTDLDLFAANGHIQPMIQDGSTYRQTAQLFLNRGNGTFEDASSAAGRPILDSLVARAAAYADIDRDGDQDILLTENGGPAHLWRNDTRGNHFLRVRLRGTASNRDGLDAQLTASLGNLQLYRRVRTGGSYLSNSEKTVTFGLGRHTSLDSLVVKWPSGQVDRLGDVAADQQILLMEGQPGYRREALPGLAAARRAANTSPGQR